MNVLVAYDGSAESKRAVQWIARLGDATAVTVISIAPTLEATARIADAVDPTSDSTLHRAQLEAAVEFLAPLGITPRTVLRAGNPAEEIITYAAEENIDLILVGIRGMNAARRFLIGSVAERVVRHASVPVLVVR